MRTLTVTVAVGVLIGALRLPHLTAQQPAFGTRTEIVEVDAVVVDSKWQTITGLHREDFEIREDGRPVPIVTFVPVAARKATGVSGDAVVPSSEHQGRLVVLLLDDLFTAPMATARIKSIARIVIDRMGVGDEVGVVRLNGDSTRTTTDRQQVLEAVAKLAPTRPMWLSKEQALGMYDHAIATLSALGQQLADVRHRRKTLLIVGAPAIFSPTIPSYVPGHQDSYSAQWHDAIQSLARANVSVYLIDPRGLPQDGADVSNTAPTTDAARGLVPPATDSAMGFTRQTGGDAFVNTNMFERAIDRMWREAGDYYLLGYEPPVQDAKMHAIEVHVNVRGAQVHARKFR